MIIVLSIHITLRGGVEFNHYIMDERIGTIRIMCMSQLDYINDSYIWLQLSYPRTRP